MSVYLSEKIKNIFSKERITIAFLFILFFSYALFLLQGLSFYMYGYDDFHIIYQTLQISFTDLLSFTFFKPVQLFQGFLALGSYQRTVYGFFLKISYMIGGLDPFYYHGLRAVFFALTGVFVYLFTKKTTKNKTVSIAAGFLYCSLPVIYDGLRHIGAAEPFSQFFLLVTLYLFVILYNYDQDSNRKRTLFYPLIIFILGIFAIKSRETEIVIIPIISSFLLLKHKEWQKNKKWWLVVFGLSLYLLPTIFFYIGLDEDIGHNTVPLTFEKTLINIKNLLLHNPDTRTGNGEQTLVLFSPKQYIVETPGSLLGSIGFFLCWYVLFIFCAGIYFLFKNRKQEIQTPILIPFNNYFTIALLWLFFAVLLMVLYVKPSDHSDIRYIGVMMLPAILVVVSFCYFITEYIKKLNIKYLSQCILIIFFIVLLLSIIINTEITGIHRRGGIGSRHVGMQKSVEIIFEDLYKQPFDKSYFFALTEISGNENAIPCILSINVSLSEVTVTNDPFLSFGFLITHENIEKMLSKYGVVYIISYKLPSSEHPILNTYTSLQLIEEVNTCEEGYYCRIKEIVKKGIVNQEGLSPYLLKNLLQQEPRYYVYKIKENKTIVEKPIKMFCLGKEGIPKNSII